MWSRWRIHLRRLSPATEGVRRKFGKLNATLAEAIEGIETVKGAAQEAREEKRFALALSEWRKAAVRQGDVESRFLPLLCMASTIALGLLHSLFAVSGRR